MGWLFMTDANNIHRTIERSKQMALVAGVVSLISIFSACFTLFSSSNENWHWVSTFILGGVPFLISFIFAVAAMFCAILQRKGAEEVEEQSLLERRKGAQSAFDIKDEIRFSAKRSLERYVKYGGYTLSLVAAVVVSYTLIAVRGNWGRVLEGTAVVPDALLVVSAILLFLAVFTGAFCLGQSREPESRWLRPAGGWLIVAAIVNLFTVISGISAKGEFFDIVNTTTSAVAFWGIALLGLELVAGLIMEFYRPRTNVLELPIFESRLLSLFTESGGIMRNIENTLDYQFGFKISQTSLYSFFERSLLSFALIWLLALWLFTTFAQVLPGEQGLRERFGRVIRDEVVEAGIHFKLPWPFEQIRRVSVSKIHEVVIGGRGDKRPETVLWNEEHYGTTVQYLVGTKNIQSDEQSNESLVSFLNVRIPIHYRVRAEEKSVYNFLYSHDDAVDALQKVGEVAVTKYFASVDVIDIMSKGRGKAVRDLQKQIQLEADKLELGVDIVAVNLHDVHPPIGDEQHKVAEAFQDVIGAQEDKKTSELDGQVYERTIQPSTEAETAVLLDYAKSYEQRVLTVSKAESERFLKQVDGYSASPGLYKLRTYLTMFEALGPDVRKYIVSDSMQSEVFEIDLEEKSRMDLLDVDLGEL